MTRKGIDIKNLTIIDESAVPAKPVRYTPYREMLKRIRKGKALVLSEQEVNIETARAGIKRLQEKGEFKNFEIRQMKLADGSRRLYIINPSAEQGVTEEKEKAG
jgi:hypothetical protein